MHAWSLLGLLIIYIYIYTYIHIYIYIELLARIHIAPLNLYTYGEKLKQLRKHNPDGKYRIIWPPASNVPVIVDCSDTQRGAVLICTCSQDLSCGAKCTSSESLSDVLAQTQAQGRLLMCNSCYKGIFLFFCLVCVLGGSIRRKLPTLVYNLCMQFIHPYNMYMIYQQCIHY